MVFLVPKSFMNFFQGFVLCYYSKRKMIDLMVDDSKVCVLSDQYDNLAYDANIRQTDS